MSASSSSNGGRIAAGGTASGLYAHPDELLEDHLLAVAQRAAARAHELPVFGLLPRDLLCLLAYVGGAAHDLAKATRYFQEYLAGRGAKDRYSQHALLSAVLGAMWAEQVVADSGDQAGDLAAFAAVACFLAIRRHHGALHSAVEDCGLLDEDRELLRAQWANVDRAAFDHVLVAVKAPWNADAVGEQLEDFLATKRESRWRRIVRRVAGTASLCPYLVENLLFSLLLEADRMVTAAAGDTVLPRRAAVATDAVVSYRATRGWGAGATVMDALREELYSGVTARAQSIDLEQRLLTVTAPTGLGKTLTGMAAALELRRRVAAKRSTPPRIVYALPFLSIIDQNYQVLGEVFDHPGSDILIAHHHLGDTVYRQGEDDFDPDVSSLLIEGWESEVVVTTFVQLFHTLVNQRNRPLRRFAQLAGAIVVLDEIQAIPTRYWPLLRELTAAWAKHFDTRFLLMTATQPAIFPAGMAEELVLDPPALFRKLDRTQLELRLESELTLDDLAKMVADDLAAEPDASCIVVLNTIRAARTFLDLLSGRDLGGRKLLYLSSHVVPAHRLARIAKIRSSGQPFVLVSTQVVEAGVDIDADIVYRDIGPLDAINQVAGRCNRHWRRSRGRVVVVSLRDEVGQGRTFASYVYDPVLLDATRHAFSSLRVIPEPQFIDCVRAYFADVAQRIAETPSREVLEAIQQLNYDGDGGIASFRLIEDQYAQADVFIELDDQAAGTWQAFRNAQQLRDRWQRRAALTRLRREAARYMISVDERLLWQNPPVAEGGLFYVPRSLLITFYDRVTGYRPAQGASIGAGTWTIW